VWSSSLCSSCENARSFVVRIVIAGILHVLHFRLTRGSRLASHPRRLDHVKQLCPIPFRARNLRVNPHDRDSKFHIFARGFLRARNNPGGCSGAHRPAGVSFSRTYSRISSSSKRINKRTVRYGKKIEKSQDWLSVWGSWDDCYMRRTGRCVFVVVIIVSGPGASRVDDHRVGLREEGRVNLSAGL